MEFKGYKHETISKKSVSNDVKQGNDTKTSCEYDLFNNPMVNAARKALTPEQQKEYAQIGEYMYNSTDYKTTELGGKIKTASSAELALYALNSVKSGLDPIELSPEELEALKKMYGSNWYTQYGFSETDIPKPMFEMVDAENSPSSAQLEQEIENLKTKMCRQQRRLIERTMKKAQKKFSK